MHMLISTSGKPVQEGTDGSIGIDINIYALVKHCEGNLHSLQSNISHNKANQVVRNQIR